MGKHVNKQDDHEEREAQKYEHPIPSRDFILDYLAERGRPATRKRMLEDLGLETFARKKRCVAV